MFGDVARYSNLVGDEDAWFGKTPNHWNILPARALLDESKVTGHENDPLLSVTIKRGVIPQSDLLSDSSKKDSSNVDKSKYKLVEPGDIVYNKMRAWQGALGLSRHMGIVSPAYVVMRPRQTSGRFLEELMRTPAFAKEAERWSYGITSDMWSLRPEHFKLVYFPVPPTDEQAAIVKYLGHAHARIDQAIAVKRKVISLLEEQKQAIVHEAVTRGLDPSVPLKYSGIPWLGEIPVHWRIERAKYVLREIDVRSTSGDEEQLSVSHLTGVSPRKATVTMFRAESYIGHKVCRPHDLVVNTMWAWMGALGVAHDAGIVSPSYSVYRLNGQMKMRPEYLDLMLRTPHFISYFKSESTGIRPSRLRLYPDQILTTPLPIPPISEQDSIVDHLNRLRNDFNRTRTKGLAEIELLREFRTRLTSDVVTGQADVREIAANLPESTDDVLSSADDEFDDEDELIESEAEFATADE